MHWHGDADTAEEDLRVQGIFRGCGTAVGDIMDFPMQVGAGGVSGRADDADDLPGSDLLADGQVRFDELVAVAVDVLTGADFTVVAASGHGW